MHAVESYIVLQLEAFKMDSRYNRFSLRLVIFAAQAHLFPT